jgi:hypothetical protein
MKNLDNLIRLHQWHLDEKRRKVGELETLTARLKAEIEKLEASLKSEKQMGTHNAEIAMGYGICASAVFARREKLIQSLAGLKIEMVQATDDVAAAFRELKRFDLMRTRNQEKARQGMKGIQLSETDKAGSNVCR